MIAHRQPPIVFDQVVQTTLRDPVSAWSSDNLVYRINERTGKLEILNGTRGNTPWQGYCTVPFGGYGSPKDRNPVKTAKRETLEETGAGEDEIITENVKGLKTETEFLIGAYGPHRRHWVFNESGIAVPTQEQGHILPVLAFVFAARVIGGDIEDTAEQQGIKFTPVDELIAEHGQKMAFDHARALSDFLQIHSKEHVKAHHVWAMHHLFLSDE